FAAVRRRFLEPVRHGFSGARVLSPGFWPGESFSLIVNCERARGGSAASARRQNCARRMIRAEVIGAINGKKIRQPGARAIDAALDRSHRAIADGGSLFI